MLKKVRNQTNEQAIELKLELLESINEVLVPDDAQGLCATIMQVGDNARPFQRMIKSEGAALLCERGISVH
jgi:hypothetical protein